MRNQEELLHPRQSETIQESAQGSPRPGKQTEEKESIDGYADSVPESEVTGSPPPVAEPFHWKEALLTAACFVAGLVVVSNSKDPQFSLLGAGLILASIVGAVVTGFWTKVDSLDPFLKLLAYLPVIGGAIVGIVVVIAGYLVYFIVVEGTKSHFADMERQSREDRILHSWEEDAIKKQIQRYQDEHQ